MPRPTHVRVGALYKIHLDQNSPSKILGTRHAKGLSVRDDALEAFRAEALRRMSAEELAHFELGTPFPHDWGVLLMEGFGATNRMHARGSE